MTDYPEAVREYEERKTKLPDNWPLIEVACADAAIAALKAEVERLKREVQPAATGWPEDLQTVTEPHNLQYHVYYADDVERVVRALQAEGARLKEENEAAKELLVKQGRMLRLAAIDFWKTTEPEERPDPYDVECLVEEAALARAEAEEETCG